MAISSKTEVGSKTRIDSEMGSNPEMASDTILEFDKVVGGYGSTTILHETSLKVERGKLSTIIGPNGAGKSTALKAIFSMVKVRSARSALKARTSLVRRRPSCSLAALPSCRRDAISSRR